MTWFEFFVISLASFRLTRLIVFDSITSSLRAPFFEESKEVNEDGVEETYYVPKKGVVKNFIGELLSCYWCSGMWIAFICTVGYLLWPQYTFPLFLIFAVAGVAAIIESIVGRLV